MRRYPLGILSVVSILAVAMAGCSAAGNGSTATGGAGGSLNADYADALPVVTQLVVGTLKLDETDLAVTSDQAQQLVPLWQAYRALETSQTSAQQEREALVTQIEETMTSDQIRQIAGMKLTTADMQTLFRSRFPQAQGTPSGTQAAGGRQFSGQGGGFNGGGGFPRDGGGGFVGGGGVPGGGFAGGGGGNFFGGLAPGETPNPQAIETLRAERGGATGQNGVNPGLISLVLQYLQAKAGVIPVATPTAG